MHSTTDLTPYLLLTNVRYFCGYNICAARERGVSQYSMQVVGFEVMACSIKRKAGARVEPLSCVGNDDRTPEPQEVVKGQSPLHSLCSYSSCLVNTAIAHASHLA